MTEPRKSESKPKRHAKRKPKRQKTLVRQLIIDRLGRSGDGLAGDVAVPFALPDEHVTLEEGGHGVRVKIDTPSQRRAEALCPHFMRCGGCHLQHFGLEQSLVWKEQRLQNALQRENISIPPMNVMQAPLYSRRRAKFALKRQGNAWTTGFRGYKSHDIINLKACVVVDKDILAVAFALRLAARDIMPAGINELDAFFTKTKSGIDLFLSGFNDQTLPLEAREALTEFAKDINLARLTLDGVACYRQHTPMLCFDGLNIALPAEGFLQASEEGEVHLQQLVSSAVAGAPLVADLFCGIGTFAVPIAKHAAVSAIDSDGLAIAALHRAAIQSGRPIQAAQRDLYQQPLSTDELTGFDAIVFDPPRAGAQEQCRAMVASGVQVIVAVSCSPDTLARDLAVLSEAYDIVQLNLVDQFLFTPHIETVAVLKRR